jgi:hypothetical protein
MPSLFRFLFVTGTFAAIVFGGLFFMGRFYEPEPQEVTKVVPGVKIRKQ